MQRYLNDMYTLFSHLARICGRTLGVLLRGLRKMKIKHVIDKRQFVVMEVAPVQESDHRQGNQEEGDAAGEYSSERSEHIAQVALLKVIKHITSNGLYIRV